MLLKLLNSTVYEIIVYEFQLKYFEVYIMKETFRFSTPKTWKDMKHVHETVIGFLKYEVCINCTIEATEYVTFFTY